MTDIAAIAKGLTADERKVILAMSDGGLVLPASRIAADCGLPLASVRGVMRRFRSIRIATYGPLWNEDEHQPAGSGTWLNNVGLEVRRIVEIEYV